jgi:hypothetical protein
MQSWLGILFVVMAFGPLAIMGALWIVALVLWLAGRPRFLVMLAERTGVGQRRDTAAEGEQGEEHGEGAEAGEEPGPSGEPPAGTTTGER